MVYTTTTFRWMLFYYLRRWATELEKNNSVFGKRPNISSALCSGFLLSVKKKLIEGPAKYTFINKDF